MISGRGLGHTGGTLDKLDAIPGYVSQPDPRSSARSSPRSAAPSSARPPTSRRPTSALRDPRRHRDGRIDPADHRLDPVEEARRRARRAGPRRQDRLNGAFMPTREAARALAESLVAVANGAGLRTAR
jgi:thymidine phosphorylase